MTRPDGRLVSKPQLESRSGTARAPALAKAAVNARACQSKRSIASAICGYQCAGRAEQGRVDFIEIAFIGFEDLREGAAIIARCRARQSRCEFFSFAGWPRYEKMRLSAINDRVVRAAHRGHEIRMRRRQGGRRDAVDHMRQRKFEFMHFMHGDFQNT
jgi:hypothetical protein